METNSGSGRARDMDKDTLKYACNYQKVENCRKLFLLASIF